MTHPHPSDLPMIVPASQGSAAIISRATGGIRWVKRPYIPAPWCPMPPKRYVEKYIKHHRHPPKWAQLPWEWQMPEEPPRQMKHISGPTGKPVGWGSA